MAEQVLVLGVGNILFSDEAIGVRTVEHCSSAHPCPEMWSSWTAARSASG